MNQLNSNYPPHNIIRVDDYNYIIEVAIAGFKKEEIVVSIEQEILTITGSKNKTDDSGLQYLHRGLSSRDFVRSFTLAEHIVVKNAVISDGILSIKLEHIIPEEKKPRLIEITQLD
jgi:molecular chaperone IbpA